MKYILAILCLIMAIICYVKPDLVENTNMLFGLIFLQLTILHFHKKDD